jgi:hypothetical protein
VFSLFNRNREKNRNGDTAMDLIRGDDTFLREIFKQHTDKQSMKRSVRNDDFADGGYRPDCSSLFS